MFLESCIDKETSSNHARACDLGNNARALRRVVARLGPEKFVQPPRKASCPLFTLDVVIRDNGQKELSRGKSRDKWRTMWEGDPPREQNQDF